MDRCEKCHYDCDDMDGRIREHSCNECPLYLEFLEEEKATHRRMRIEVYEQKVDRDDPF